MKMSEVAQLLNHIMGYPFPSVHVFRKSSLMGHMLSSTVLACGFFGV